MKCWKLRKKNVTRTKLFPLHNVQQFLLSLLFEIRCCCRSSLSFLPFLGKADTTETLRTLKAFYALTLWARYKSFVNAIGNCTKLWCIIVWVRAWAGERQREGWRMWGLYFWGYGVLKNIIEYCNLIPERNIFIKTTALGVKMLFNEAMLNSYNLCITKAINYVFVSKER